jgi:hypothetical protein
VSENNTFSEEMYIQSGVSKTVKNSTIILEKLHWFSTISAVRLSEVPDFDYGLVKIQSKWFSYQECTRMPGARSDSGVDDPEGVMGSPV